MFNTFARTKHKVDSDNVALAVSCLHVCTYYVLTCSIVREKQKYQINTT